jgi:hypothetical protein
VEPHPDRLSVTDDGRRSRAAVFFRVFLVIPHWFWFGLWSIAVFFVAIAQWLVILVRAQPAAGPHRFLERYVRYTLHVSAYLFLACDVYPPFGGRPGYGVDIESIEPERQGRLGAFFRLVLAIPALLLTATLVGWGGGVRGGAYGFYFSFFTVVGMCSLFSWFVSLALGRSPLQLRDLSAYALGYSAQVNAYCLLVTRRYPNTDPTALLATVARPPAHPVRLEGDAAALRRSRLTVLFRLPFAIPHIVWLYLWGYACNLVAIIDWFVTLFRGRSPRWCHQFLSRYVRYQFHVGAFLSLAANPFPGFVGAHGSYPLDLVLPAEPERQNRWKTGFRIVLVLPAFLIAATLQFLLVIAAICTWFASLVTGSAPAGLRNTMAFGLRYYAQSSAYLYLLTDRYPNASPLEGTDPPPPPRVPDPVWDGPGDDAQVEDMPADEPETE